MEPTLVELSKAVRPYDPETKRQRRYGMATGAAGAGAVGLGASAARGVDVTRQSTGLKQTRRLRDLRRVRSPIRVTTKPETVARVYAEPVEGLMARGPGGRIQGVGERFYRRPVHGREVSEALTRRKAKALKGKAAGAVGLAGLAGMLYARGESNKNRRWL